MTTRCAMSERRRVLLALQGKRFPREGDLGLYSSRRWDRELLGQVVVVRVSPSGQTIWTRFADRRAQVALGGHIVEHRWWRAPESEQLGSRAMVYGAGVDARLAPYGRVRFPAPDPLPFGTL